MASKYALHKAKWSACTDCNLCSNRHKIVLARGSIPCDILFLGEAPGASENSLGQPFIGPAGKLLDWMIQKVLSDQYIAPLNLKYACTNMVACLPDRTEEGKIGVPTLEQAKACSSRLQEFITLSRPKLILCLGKIPAEYAPLVLDTLDPTINWGELYHPAAILRYPDMQKNLAIQRWVAGAEDRISATWLVPF